jgi:phosphoglycerate dehydrogenase-like enzyme
MSRPQAIYFSYSPLLEEVYGPEQRNDIEAQVEIVGRVSEGGYRTKFADQTWPGASFIFATWGLVPIDEEFLRCFPDLEAIFYAAGTIRSFATDAMWERGIRVTCAAVANAVPVAEFTVSQIFFSLKLGWRTMSQFRETKSFSDLRYRPPGSYRTTVALLSLGNVGQMVAKRLRSSDLKVIAYDPYVSPEVGKKLGVTMVSLDDAFALADVVSCHIPDLPETRQMLTAQHFSLMRPNATFLNTARGQIVDEPGLIDVLRQRPDMTAVLDVTDPEPPADDSPFYTLPNVFLTPHIAGSNGSERHRLGQMMADEVRRYLSGDPMLHEIKRSYMMTIA